MTDRYITLAVTLEEPIRSDDCQPLIDAIKQLRGVLSVDAGVCDYNYFAARLTVRQEMGEALWEVLYPKDRASGG